MNLVNALLSCLNQEDALIVEFTAALEAETRALTEHGAFDTLHEITDQKNALAEQLVALSAQRDEILAQLGFAAGHDGTVQAAAAHAEIAAPWQTLMEHSALARELNARNGALIDVQLSYTRQSLDALRAIAGIGSVYDAQGRSRTATGGKSIVAG